VKLPSKVYRLAEKITQLVDFFSRKIVISVFTALFIISYHTCAQNSSPVIVIHGGAGTIKKGSLSDSLEKVIRGTLKMAMDEAYAVMDEGGSSLEAVAVAIAILENAPEFNAGKGAVMNAVGKHELDASIMDGKTLDAGAVAGVSQVKNPIYAAMAVMKETPHVMLAGDGANQLAKETGLEMVENKYFTTPRILKRYQSLRGDATTDKSSKYGTVGAVALDKNGNIAAGTSTGGMMNKRYNRIGDSPIIGAGTYASNATCGVSCTGHGEYFIRVGVAKEISDRMEFGDYSLEEAVEMTLERIGSLGASGGVIAIDSEGNVSMDFNTEGMYRGYKRADETKVAIYGSN